MSALSNASSNAVAHALSPVALVAAAQSFVGFHEEKGKRRGGGRGQIVERFLTELGEAPDDDWSAAFVHHVGYWSHYHWRDEYSSWPLPPGDCRKLARYAAEHGVLTEEPQSGDLFVQYSSVRGRHVRAGIILAVTRHGRSFGMDVPFVECEVIEGNSTMSGSLGGVGIVRVRRKLCLQRGADCVVRWTSLSAGRAILRRAA